MPIQTALSTLLLVMLDADNNGNPLLQTLQRAGYPVQPCCGLQAALESLRRERAGLIILAGMGAPAPCRAIRRLTAAPILVLLGGGGEAELLAALEAGADDCQPVSIGQSETLGRVRALLRRASYSGATDRNG
jgi:two-component system, OmpR family, response regulator MtrA